jgi:V/A-type H+-transporting ATPase subunit K
MELGLILAIAGPILAMTISGIGSAIGVGLAGQAAGGVISEDPDKFGKMIPIVGLPGTQGFYGFVIGFLVINKLNLLGALTVPTPHQGWQILAICFVVSFVECVSAIHQGKVSVASVGILAKRPEALGKAIVLPVFVEIYAILGLGAFFLLLQGVGGMTIDSITPESVEGTQVEVEINGSGFTSGAEVLFEKGEALDPKARRTLSPRVTKTAFVDSHTITAIVEPRPGRTRWDVRVKNPDGSSAALADAFTVK